TSHEKRTSAEDDWSGRCAVSSATCTSTVGSRGSFVRSRARGLGSVGVLTCSGSGSGEYVGSMDGVRTEFTPNVLTGAPFDRSVARLGKYGMWTPVKGSRRSM